MEDPAFPAYFRHATPIEAIESLPIGSRPSRRTEPRRARPTSRHPLHVRLDPEPAPADRLLWPGERTGGAWPPATGPCLREMHEHWPFFRALVDNAELALAKAEPAIVARYVALMPEREDAQRISRRIEEEYRKTRDAILCVTHAPSCWTTRPGCGVRSPCETPTFDILNFAQIELLRRRAAAAGPDTAVDELLRSSVQAISAGMRTTG